VGFVSKRSVRLQRSFPLTAVIGMDHIKQALLLGACDTGASPQDAPGDGQEIACCGRTKQAVTC
jgi:hypothetical protein